MHAAHGVGGHPHLEWHPAERPEQRLDAIGAALLVVATGALLLACDWRGELNSWSSPQITGLIAGTVVLASVLVVRERRAADPMVPVRLLRTHVGAVVSASLFLATAALFAVTVFAPLFLQTTTGATPTQPGQPLVPAMLGSTVSSTLSGRSIARTGRYKRFPLGGAVGAAVLGAVFTAHAGVPASAVTLHTLRARVIDGDSGLPRRGAARGARADQRAVNTRKARLSAAVCASRWRVARGRGTRHVRQARCAGTGGSQGRPGCRFLSTRRGVQKGPALNRTMVRISMLESSTI